MEFDFDAFWARYPRKDAKKRARQAWKKITPPAAVQIQTALDWQLPLWAGRDVQFVPLPATYLNGERWTDEPPTMCMPAWQRRSLFYVPK